MRVSDKVWVSAAFGLIASGCGPEVLGICGAPSSSALEAVSGIYQATAYTQNETTCDAEGPSKLDELRDPFFVVTTRSDFGREVGLLVTCADVADCRSKAASANSTGVSGQILETLSCEGSDTGITGETVTTGSSGGEGQCDDATIAQSTLDRDGQSVRLEIRAQHGESYPADSQGFCDTDRGYEVAKDEPCTELIVLTGDFVEAL